MSCLLYNYEIRFADFIQGVAQPGSARALGARGREFESHHPDHLSSYCVTGDE
jgi:hypothetical protein